MTAELEETPRPDFNYVHSQKNLVCMCTHANAFKEKASSPWMSKFAMQAESSLNSLQLNVDAEA